MNLLKFFTAFTHPLLMWKFREPFSVGHGKGLDAKAKTLKMSSEILEAKDRSSSPVWLYHCVSLPSRPYFCGNLHYCRIKPANRLTNCNSYCGLRQIPLMSPLDRGDSIRTAAVAAARRRHLSDSEMNCRYIPSVMSRLMDRAICRRMIRAQRSRDRREATSE